MIGMTTLKDLCTLIVDCEHKTAPIQDTGYPSIRTPNIGRGRLLLDGVNQVSDETYRLWTQREVPKPGDLILAREAPIGNVAIIPLGLKVCLGQRTVLIRPNDQKINAQYLTYLLLGDELQGRIQSQSNGATVHHLNMSDIRNLEIPPLPAPRVQDRIASILSAYDDLIENNTRRIKILEEMSQMIYREWFVNFRFPGHEKVKMVESDMGMIPALWQTQRFTEVSEVLSGGTPKTSVPEFWNGGIPFFGPTDAPTAFFVTQTEKGITPLGLSRCNSKLYPAETVFITARGTVGKIAMPAEGMAMNQSCYALRGKSGLSQLFLFMLTKQRTEELKKKAHGAVFDTITIETFSKLTVVRPADPLPQQFEAVVRPLFSLMLTLQRSITNLQETRNLLLPRLISGEINVEQVETEHAAQSV